MIFSCLNLAVPMDIMQHVVKVESSGNPFAIGVVGGRLERQPRNLAEAVATAKMLEQRGYNFSVGVAQINRYNLSKYGLKSYEQAFQVCPNLYAGTRILKECYDRSMDWGKSFSCYYSGNFVTGFRHGYVQKVFSSMGKGAVKMPSFYTGPRINVIADAAPAARNPVQSAAAKKALSVPRDGEAVRKAYANPTSTDSSASMQITDTPKIVMAQSGSSAVSARAAPQGRAVPTPAASAQMSPSGNAALSRVDSAFVF